MTTHHLVIHVRRALDLETDARATELAAEAVAAFLNAIIQPALRKEIESQLPDRLSLAARHSSAAENEISPLPEDLAPLLGLSEGETDHLLRVVWTLLQDLLSPSDIVRLRLSFPPELGRRLDEYDLLAEEEKDALHGDVAVYQYQPEEQLQAALLSGGDVDAAWQEAEGSGEETVGGSVITPDQDVVEEIGEALGVTYRFNEPLRPAGKESDRDRMRWEMDPASSEDFRSRSRQGRRKPKD